jgi:hypothetical protein
MGDPTFASSGRDDVARIPEADRVRVVVAGTLDQDGGWFLTLA